MEEIIENEKQLYITILNADGEEVSTYHGAISDPKMAQHYFDYLNHLARIDMGGNEGVHKLSPTKE
jgi:hypothetical protein